MNLEPAYAKAASIEKDEKRCVGKLTSSRICIHKTATTSNFGVLRELAYSIHNKFMKKLT